MDRAARERIAALDLIRGVAVLGILAVNVAGFAGPPSASYTPAIPLPASRADEWAFAVMLVLFEGKMRALFSLLFGASMLLFVERAEAQGRDGQALQLRRLGWLALFGYLHFLLLWWGDILFLYAVAGVIALALRKAEPRALAIGGLGLFAVWQLSGTAIALSDAAKEQVALARPGDPALQKQLQDTLAPYRQQDASDSAEARAPWQVQVARKASERPFYPLRVVLFTLGETLPYMLLGMALFRSGFFAGGWSGRQLRIMAVCGLGAGGAVTLLASSWALQAHYPELTMRLLINDLLGLPHLAMALGYAALLMLAAPLVIRSWIGQRLIAAGRMAFSNYIGTSLVMCGIFYGWGLGRFGQAGAAEHWLFVVLGWALMLAWSAPWLAHFRQGPLEWLWRSLTEWRRLPLRRATS